MRTTPLWPYLLALLLLAAWRWLHWKRQALQARRDLKAWKEALHALAYEVSNAANAARANLLDFRHANSAVQSPEHLDEIQTATDRLSAILRIADDPAAWHRKKTGSAE
jgi:hypothetical protein